MTMKGEQITTLEQLAAAREQRKSVTCPKMFGWGERQPAAWMMNLSGEMLHRLFRAGMFIYLPNPKKNRNEH